jgi:CheY-like chemotaxis protein
MIRDVETAASKWVLVVDDDQDTREIVVEMLEDAGYAAIAAAGGAAALRLMQQQAPALVLSDLVMSEMDGKELFARTRELLGASMPPFVFLTGLPPTFLSVSETVLTKPYDLDQLLEVVGHHCSALAAPAPRMLVSAAKTA